MTLNAIEAKTLASGRTGRGVQSLVSVEPTALAKDALEKMRDSGIHHLVVEKDGRCVGLVSARELITATLPEHWYGAGRQVTVSEIMRTHVPTIDESADIGTALALMLENGLTALPITRDGQLSDIVTETDLLRLLQRLGSADGKSTGILAQGEATLANPLMQNLMHSLANAGL